MLFNSLSFAWFLPVALTLYWMANRNLRLQNVVLVALSYFFYGYWDWRFLALLIGSTVLDFFVARALGDEDREARRRALLSISMIGNLSVLGFFKYFNFFVAGAARVLSEMGLPADVHTLSIVLPVGISFYTFQTMSYTVDVYRRTMKPTKDFIALAAYVSFFPQLVAGPIERGSRLLPQMYRARYVLAADIQEGFWLILLGFFRKTVIADNMAYVADRVYNGDWDVGALNLLIGTTAFALQIYCDFSGYSNIARGVAKWFGFDLMVNFRTPYGSRSVQEFWRRWHISLSTWLRDYLYIPLGGNAKGSVRTYVNLMLTMLLGGLWHGAAANFIAWGAWQGVGLIGHRLLFHKRVSGQFSNGLLRAGWSALSWVLTMLFVLQGWLLFRAYGLKKVGHMSGEWLDWGHQLMFTGAEIWLVVIAAIAVAFVDFVESRDYEAFVGRRAGIPVQLALSVVLILAVLLFGSFREQPFLYFQF